MSVDKIECTCQLSLEEPEEPPPPMSGTSRRRVSRDAGCDKLIEAERAKEELRKQLERECKEMAMRYTLPTRMGNWFEAQAVAEVKMKMLHRKLQACATFFQKQNLVREHLFTPSAIAKYDIYVMYNTPMQILSEVNKRKTDDKPYKKLVLSVLITEMQIESFNSIRLSDISVVSMAYENNRLRRNVFIVESINAANNSRPVFYGEDFYIRLHDNESPLYLMGDVPSLDNFGEKLGKVPMGLTYHPGRFSKFRVVDPNIKNMISLVGTPVPTFKTVCIAHTLSNRYLGVYLKEDITTLFSCDKGVYCYAYISDRYEVSPNYFQFVTQADNEGGAASDTAKGGKGSEGQ